MSIRKRVTRVALALALTVSLSWHPEANAAAPLVKTQAPGFYRMMLGDFEITTLSDGTVDLPVDKILTNTTPEQIETLLARASLKAPVETSVNAFLINTGAKLVLVDTGAGTFFGPTLGNLPASLKAAGYRPEQVDEVLITHLHSDHAGGLAVNGRAVYPNATLRMDKREADFWTTPANFEKASDQGKQIHQTAVQMLAPYRAAGKFQTFDGSSPIVPGVSAYAAHGHTAGHSAYVVESKGQKLMLWGDLMHVAAVQFPHPSVTITYDSDSNAARPQREKLFADAAKQGYIVGVAHISFPGLGRLRSEGTGYVWVPVNYSVPR